MNENHFSWWIYSKSLQRLHDDSPLLASCQVLKIYGTFSISEGPQEIHAFDDNQVVL